MIDLRRVRWGLLAFWLAYLGTVGSFAACGGRAAYAAARATMPPEPRPEVLSPAPKTVAEADHRLEDAQGRAQRAQRDLDAARTDIKALEAERDWLEQQRARARLAWFAGVLELAAIGFGAFAFFSPIGRTWIVYAAVGCQAGVALALAVRAVYAWLPLVGGCIGMAFVAIAAWKVRKLVLAGRAAADHGDRLEQAILGVHDWIAGERASVEDVLKTVKRDSAIRQQEDGVRNALAALRLKPRPKPVQPDDEPPAPPADQPPAPVIAGGAA